MGAGGNLGAALGQGGGVFNSPGMESLMGQMRCGDSSDGRVGSSAVWSIITVIDSPRDNPTLMSQMMSAPYMQSMFSSLAANPDQAAQMLSSSPMFAGNPGLQQQVRSYCIHCNHHA